MMLRTQTLILLVLSLYDMTMAVTFTPKSMIESELSLDQTSQRNILHSAANLLQQNTMEFMQQRRRSLMETSATSTCPVCDERLLKDENDGDNNNRVGSVIGKVQDKLNTKGSVLNTLKGGILNVTQNAIQQGPVSVETLIPILLTAANQFTSIKQKIQSNQQTYISSNINNSNDVVSADTADLVMAIYDLLEGIVVAIADVLFSIIDIISSISTAIVQFIVDIILAILNLIEGIKLGVIQIIVDFLNAITGGINNVSNRKMMEMFDANEDGPIGTLKNILSSGRFGGIYHDIIESLQENNDDSGLISVLLDSAVDMGVLNDKLDVFVEQADQALSSQNTDASSTSEVSTAISDETVAQILDLIVDTITTILNLIVSIITSVLNLVVGIITAVIDLVVGIIVGIIELIVSILNAILGIFTGRMGTASTQAVTLLGIATTITASPIYDITLCQLGVSSCTLSPEDVVCELQSLECQNEQLNKAMTA